MVKWVERIREFLLVDVWREVPTPSRVKAAVLHLSRIAILAARDFLGDRCAMRATALAYVTLLSLVPLLAFAFSVLKGLGIQERLQPVIIKAAAGQEEVVEQILAYVDRTNVKALGIIGVVFLVWTTIKVLGNIEKSFNEIWGVTRSRTLFRKFTDYVSVLVTSPLLLVLAMSVTGILQSDAVKDHLLLGFASRLLVGVAPFVGTWVAFTAVYIFMPNTKVRFTSAFAGGVVGGTAWQLAFWIYTSFQVGMAKYNAIYGTFAAVPVFMIWLYLSWVIVLLGAEVSWAVQNVGRYWDERQSAGVSFAVREEIALHVMTRLAVAFFRDGTSLSVRDLSRRLRAPSRLVRDVLDTLVATGMCAQVVAGDDHAYVPGRALEHIRPADVVAALRTHGAELQLSTHGPEAALVAGILEADVTAGNATRDGATLRDMASRIADEPQGPDEADETPSS